MSPPHAFFGLPDLAGTALAVLLAVLLRPRGRGLPSAGRWLAAAVGSVALLIAGRVFPMELARFTGWAAFLFGPALWLWACRFTGQAGPRGQRMIVHFIPAAALLLVLLTTAPLLAAQLARPASGMGSLYVVTAIHMGVYWLLSSLRLRRGGLPREQRALWICAAVWTVWIVLGP